jgi:predicted DNA binding protein
MMEAEFSIRGMRFWIVDIATRYSCSVTVTECIPWRKKGGQALFRIRGIESDTASAIDDIRLRDDITSLDAVERSDGQVVGSVAMREFWPAWAIVECGCFLESVWSDGDGKANFRVLAGSEGSVPQLIKAIASKGLDIEIVRIAQTSNQSHVTRKQEKVVRLALEKGFFDYPRRVTLEELARLCDMSTSTVAETLKRGEKNILKHYFERGRR